jgi:hypothetical protein
MAMHCTVTFRVRDFLIHCFCIIVLFQNLRGCLSRLVLIAAACVSRVRYPPARMLSAAIGRT